MRKPLDAIPANAIVTILAILVVVSPILMKLLRPVVPYFLVLANIFFLPLLAATPFLIAVLVWRIKLWHQRKSGPSLTALPPDSISH
jgi:hypothetical protein